MTSSSSNEVSEFGFGGLSNHFLQLYLSKRKIKNFYDWQKQCLNDQRLLAGSNMIISLPTGAGKTLIAELLMLREATVKRKNSLLILPYVAIVQEKIHSLAVFDEGFDVCVEEYAANKGRFPPLKKRRKHSVYIATIEKANMLMNCLIETERIKELGLVVVDELHMLGDSHRGAFLEQTLVKFLQKGNGQIIGITATLANIEEVGRFLEASVFATNFRPVKLKEKVKVGNMLYAVNSNGELVPEHQFCDNKLGKRDPDGLVPLLQNIIPKQSVIIFCPTKQNCENVCKLIARIAPKSLRELRIEARRKVLNDLKDGEDVRLCPGLEAGFMSGVAFHHSGLSVEERRAVEAAFQDGTISIICSTSTLAAGVNLPARRVIIKGPLVGCEPLKKTQYLQMIGRAGRAGFDKEGDAVTIVRPGKEELQFRAMLSTPLEECRSSLGYNDFLSSFLLDLVSLKIAERHESLMNVVRSTLFGMQYEEAVKVAESNLMKLCSEKLISVSMDDVYTVTSLGNAAFTAGISPFEAKAINGNLIQNLFKGLVFSSHFHLIFTIIPWNISVDVDWNIFYEEFRIMPKEEQRLLASFGISEDYLVKCFINPPKVKEGDVAARVFIAFIMQRLWKHESFWDVSDRFKVSPGWLQSTLQSTCSQASSLSRFSETLWPLKYLLPDLVRKLRECKEQELVPLLALDGVKRTRARQLYDKGYKTIGSLANAVPEDLLASLEHINRRQAIAIIRSAQATLRAEVAEKLEELELLGASSKTCMAVLDNFS